MTGTVFLILCVLSSMLVPCEGQIIPPTNGTKLTFLPGTTRKIDWSVVPTSKIRLRTWNFKSSDGSRTGDLTGILGTTPEPKKLGLIPRFEIEKPATLILQNVSDSYDGVYTFRLTRENVPEEMSEVTVIIAAKPTVAVTASKTTIEEGENVMLSCKSTGGRPTASVTWRKNGEKIGKTEVQNNTLVLSGSSEDKAIYECTAESYPDVNYRDVKSVELIVNFGPRDTKISFSEKQATVGKQFNITCEAEGHPKPTYAITHNGTVVSNTNELIINKVDYTDAGTYKCVATRPQTNKTDSYTEILSVGPETTPTPAPNSTQTSTTSTETTVVSSGADKSEGLGAGAIAGIVIGVLVLVVIIIVVVYYCKSKERSGYKGNANVRPGGNERNEADENAYDSVAPSRASGSKDKPPKGEAPVLYSTVDKDNRQGRPLYATLDEAALQSQGSSRTPDEARPEPTQYASIEFGRNGDREVPRADLV